MDNPVFAVGAVQLGADGSGTFSFVVPAAALGRAVSIELVDWTAPISVGVATVGDGRLRPTRVNAGGGPVPSVPLPAGLLILLAAAALAVVERERHAAWIFAVATRPRRARPIPGRTLRGS